MAIIQYYHLKPQMDHEKPGYTIIAIIMTKWYLHIALILIIMLIRII